MDDSLEKAIHDIAIIAERLGTAFYVEICEAAQCLNVVFSEAMEELNDDLAAVSSAYNEIMEAAYERSEAKRQEQKKWRRCMSVRIPVFLYDKRGKVHRCRNNC